MSASLEIAKGDSFTPQVTWTIQHKNIPQLTHTVTLSAGIFYHYVNPDDIPKDLSLILKNVSTVTAGTPDVNVINSSSDSIGTADFIITNAKEDDGRVRIITDANALKADTGLTLSGLVETLSSGSVTVSVNVTSLDNIYQEVKIDLITVNRNGNNQFSADDVTGWSGSLGISNTGVTSYPTIFNIGADVSDDTSVYHADNFGISAGNRSHETSVSAALTNSLVITPKIVDAAAQNASLSTGTVTTISYSDPLSTVKRISMRKSMPHCPPPSPNTLLSQRSLQAGNVLMIHVSIKSSLTSSSTTKLLGVDLSLGV